MAGPGADALAEYASAMVTQRTMCSMVAVLLVVAGACGSDDDGPLTTSPAPTTADADRPPPADDSDAAQGQDRSAELVGRWDIVTYLVPEGGFLTNIVGDAPVFIEFGADGSVGYHTGCNAGGTEFETRGTYAVPRSALDDTPEGQEITIGPSFEQTEIGCDGFLGDQDRDLPANMGNATRFAIDGDRLYLFAEFLLIEASKSG